MKTPFIKLSSKVRKTILSGFALSTMAFVFQACYGVPGDYDLDVLLEGKVVDASNNALKNIKIRVVDKDMQRQVTTNDTGHFELYTAPLTKELKFSYLNASDSSYIQLVKIDTVELSSRKFNVILHKD